MKLAVLSLAAIFIGLVIYIWQSGSWQSQADAVTANESATLTISPPEGEYQPNQVFDIDIKLSTGGQAVSGLSLPIAYSNNFEYVSADATGSIFSTELSPLRDDNNTIFINRLRLDEGFNGTNGQVVKLTFKAINAGVASITIDPLVAEITAYANSANILKEVVNGSYTVKGETDPGEEPEVSLSLPENNSTHPAGRDIALVATATNVEDVLKVEFFKDQAKLAEKTKAPYSFNWDNVPAGQYTLSAKVTDASNKTGTSEPVNIAVAADVENVATPKVRPKNRRFKKTVKVTLTTRTPGASIRYTLDGSLPTNESPLYSGPIALTKTTNIKSQAFKGSQKSNIVSSTFKKCKNVICVGK